MGFEYTPTYSDREDKDVTPKRFKMCYADSDTFVVRCAKMMQEDYVEVKHIASGNTMEFPNVTSFGLRSGKIIELTEDDIATNQRTIKKEKMGKPVKEPYKWLAWKNHDQRVKGKKEFTVEDFEILHKARLNSDYANVEEAFKTAEMVFASNIKGIKTNMESEDYTLCISSGNGNYRNDESKTIGYKSSRLEKPIFFQEFKDKIAETYKNKIWWTENNEAEDLLQHISKQQIAKYGYNPEKFDCCGLWLDKDCDQIFMYHKNPDKYEEGWTLHDRFYCDLTLVAQTISGDKTDTIEGLPSLTESVTKHFGLRKSNGVSKSTAMKLLEDSTTIQELWKRAIYCYQQYYGFDKKYKFKDVHGDEQEWGWLDYMQQCYVLVKMQEYQGQIPQLLEYLDTIGVDYTAEILYDVTVVNVEGLKDNLEVCKQTMSTLKEELKSYKSLAKPKLVEKLETVEKIVAELDGNLGLLEE